MHEWIDERKDYSHFRFQYVRLVFVVLSFKYFHFHYYGLEFVKEKSPGPSFKCKLFWGKNVFELQLGKLSFLGGSER